jgi:outer membrane usher protein FimD/PapC
MKLINMTRDADGDMPGMVNRLTLCLDEEDLELLGIVPEVGSLVHIEATAVVAHHSESLGSDPDENAQHLVLNIQQLGMEQSARARSPGQRVYGD